MLAQLQAAVDGRQAATQAYQLALTKEISRNVTPFQYLTSEGGISTGSLTEVLTAAVDEWFERGLGGRSSGSPCHAAANVAAQQQQVSACDRRGRSVWE